MTSFHDLSSRTENLVAPALDLDALIARGEARLRRRRLSAVVAAAGVVLVLVLGSVLVNSGGRQANAPIDRPQRHDKTPAPTTPSARTIVYADGNPGRTIHFGSRVVRTGVGFAHIDVTDDGFVYSTGGYAGDGRLWFSDGGTPEQIGSHACEAAAGYAETAVSGNAGSLIAWLECTGDPLQSLVVFDTSTRREVVRRPLPPCERRRGECTLEALVGDHVYLGDQYSRPSGRIHSRGLVFDLTTSELRQVSALEELDASASGTPAYAADIRGRARGLVLGDSAQTGAPTEGIGQPFSVVGSRLVPRVRLSNGEEELATAFDTSTGRPVLFRLPRGYDAGDGDDITLFEWLDDDTVALVVDGNHWAGGPRRGDILTCRLSVGRCELAVHGRGEKIMRIVPHLDLPG